MEPYISVTPPGNTYGAFLDVQSLHVEQYLNKILDVAAKLKEVDPRYGHARIFDAVHRTKGG